MSKIRVQFEKKNEFFYSKFETNKCFHTRRWAFYWDPTCKQRAMFKITILVLKTASCRRHIYSRCFHSVGLLNLLLIYLFIMYLFMIIHFIALLLAEQKSNWRFSTLTSLPIVGTFLSRICPEKSSGPFCPENFHLNYHLFLTIITIAHQRITLQIVAESIILHCERCLA